MYYDNTIRIHEFLTAVAKRTLRDRLPTTWRRLSLPWSTQEYSTNRYKIFPFAMALSVKSAKYIFRVILRGDWIGERIQPFFIHFISISLWNFTCCFSVNICGMYISIKIRYLIIHIAQSRLIIETQLKTSDTQKIWILWFTM